MPLETRVAGIFVFWPLLAQLGFDELVQQAGYPGSGMVPATSALLSLLALKLIDNPILRQALFDSKAGAIPWAGGKTLRFTFAGTD